MYTTRLDAVIASQDRASSGSTSPSIRLCRVKASRIAEYDWSEIGNVLAQLPDVTRLEVNLDVTSISVKATPCDSPHGKGTVPVRSSYSTTPRL